MANLLQHVFQTELPKQSPLRDILKFTSSVVVDGIPVTQKNWTLRYLQSDDVAIKKVEKALAKENNHAFDLVGMGARSLILRAEDGLVVRITLDKAVSHVAKSWKHPAILQPLKSVDVPGKKRITIDWLPELDFKSITLEDEQKVQDVLFLRGLSVPDIIGNQNVGMFEVNGRRVPLLADAGELQETPSRPQGHDLKAAIRPWMDDDGVTPLQAVHAARYRSSRAI